MVRPVIKRSLSLGKVYALLEPGPVVLLTTARRGRPNVMTMSWHTMIEFEPPLVGCVVSRANFSAQALKATRQCVINIPTADLAAQVIACGNTSGRDIDDKLAHAGLTARPAAQVEPPLVGECFANLECRVVDTRLVNAYDFYILEVVQAWIAPGSSHPRTLHHRGCGEFMVPGRTLKLRSKMP